MTAKRFGLERVTMCCYFETLYVVKDNEKEMTEYQKHQRLTENEVVDLLNELHEENEQLKFQLDECQNHKLYSRRELEKENQRLQKENKELEEFRYTVFKRMDELRL